MKKIAVLALLVLAGCTPLPQVKEAEPGKRFIVQCENTGDFDSPEPVVTCAIYDRMTLKSYLWVRDMNVAGLAGGQ